MPTSTFSVSSDPMLFYFVSVLEVRIAAFETAGLLQPNQNAQLTDVKSRLAALKGAADGSLTEDCAWTEAYSLERLMASLEPEITLLDEVRRRVDEAAAEGVLAEPRLRTALTLAERSCFDQTKTPPLFKSSEVPVLRSLLNETLEETHWTMQRKYAARPFQQTATKKIVFVGFVSFLILLAPFIYTYVVTITGGQVALKTWSWLPLYVAVSAGLFGAFFSRLIYMQGNVGKMSLGELKSASETLSILLRGVVGVSGAIVIFFVLQSGLFKGALFPNFAELGLSRSVFPVEKDPASAVVVDLPSQSLCLLIVWCLLAGFSERLVPSILTSTEEQFSAASKTAKT